MIPQPCKLERYFAQWEFTAKHLLCASDVDGYRMSELLELADPETLATWEELQLGYTETAGLPELRQAISEQYVDVESDGILVCSGAAEALYLTIKALLGPDSHVVVVTPAFEALFRVAAATGAEVTSVPLDAAAGWRLDLVAVKRAVRPQTKAIFVNYPHNPTGAQLGTADFAALAELADSRGLVLLSDEVYRYLEHDPVDRLPAAADLSPRAVSVGVMSKAYGLAGLRIGWLATRNAKLLAATRTLKDYTSVCSAAPSEVLALIALRAADRVRSRCLRIVLDNLALMTEFFERWQGVLSWTPPRGGTVAFPLLEAPVPVDAFAAELVEQEGVLLLPGSAFDCADNRFRVGLGRRSTPEALDRLDGFLSRRLG
jgi:aspartate/methionine/tyrosine aminotransferase